MQVASDGTECSQIWSEHFAHICMECYDYLQRFDYSMNLMHSKKHFRLRGGSDVIIIILMIASVVSVSGCWDVGGSENWVD